MTVLLVAFGGAVGTVLRWWIGKLAPIAAGGIPWTTLGINIAGSFALGYLAPTLSVAQAAPATIAAVTVGVCGGFTTFSTFAGESLQLLQHGQWVRAAGYATGSVVLSIVAVAAGLELSKALHA